MSRRIAELALLGGAGAIALALALGIALAVPDPNFLLVLALALGAVGILALAVNTRLEVTVALLALYLGALDGPVKLLSANQAASAVRDVLIAAVALGAIVRLLARRERVATAAAVRLGDRVRRARAGERLQPQHAGDAEDPRRLPPAAGVGAVLLLRLRADALARALPRSCSWSSA